MARHARNAREAILDAAEDVVVELGARHLTLDAVAARAGISRGGFLYHFPGKVALLEAMLERHIARFSEALEKRRANLPDSAEGAVTALVLTLLERNKRAFRVTSAIIAAAAHDPKLLSEVPRKQYRALLDHLVSCGLPFERAALITVTIQGLMLGELLSMSVFNNTDEKKALMKEIISLAKKEGE